MNSEPLAWQTSALAGIGQVCGVPCGIRGGSTWSVKGVNGLGSGAPASFEARPSGSPSVDKSVYVL